MVVNTSEGGVFYAPGNSSTLTQLAALPGHTHSNYATTASLENYAKFNGNIPYDTSNFAYNCIGYGYNAAGWPTNGPLLTFGASSKYTHFIHGNNAGHNLSHAHVYNGTISNWSIILDSSNYTLYCSSLGHTHSYLPLSGGTITGTLQIKRNPSVIMFSNAGNTTLGYLGFNADDDPIIYKADRTTMRHIIHSGNIGSQSVAYAANAGGLAGYIWDSKQNSTDTWVPVFTTVNGVNKLQYRVIPNAYNGAPSTLSVGYATSAGSASKLGSTGISFTPAETALTPDDVYTLVGGTTIKRGTWSYAGNGYISNDVTGVGTIDLAGTTVIQADNGNPGYTQLYLTPSTGTTSGYKPNEIFMYNNNGSSYYPSWTRVLTNRNYADYCSSIGHTHSYLPLSGGSLTGKITITNGSDFTLQANSSNANDPGDLVFANSSGTELARIYYTSPKLMMRYGSSANSYEILTTNTGAAKSHSHTVSDLPIHTYNSGAQSLSWTDTIGASKIPTINTLAYWNGAFSGTNSNLAYCVKGAFGTIVTKNVGDYAAASHTHTDYTSYKYAGDTTDSAENYIILSLASNGTAINGGYFYGNVSFNRGGSAAWNGKTMVIVACGGQYTSNIGAYFTIGASITIAGLYKIQYNNTYYLALKIGATSSQQVRVSGVYNTTPFVIKASDATSASQVTVSNLSTPGSITAANFITSSDKRLKTNIKSLPTDSKSLELNFYEFDYVNNDNHSAGHIAQEVKEVFPELVHGNESETEHLSIDYTGLHSIQINDLIGYIKRLEKRIIELENKLS